MSPSIPDHLSAPSGSWLGTRPMPSDKTSDLYSTTRPISSAAASSNNDNWYYYLTPNAVKRLPHYEYQGGDTSPLYTYVLSPLASWCVDHLTPAWVAPNAITLLGLSWMVLSYCVIWYWCPGMYEANTEIAAVASEYIAPLSWFRTHLSTSPPGSYAVPGAIFLLNGCAMLVYQTLDNMDGKQARKTGSSSPLGLLFDHGCDAMNLMLGSANWIVAMAMVPGNVSDLLGRADHGNIQDNSLLAEYFGGDAVLATLLIICPMTAFYVTTWEQYYTGRLFLPPFNGPSEGLVMGATLSFVSFLWGPMYWHGTNLVDAAIGCFVTVGREDIAYFASLQGRVRNMDLIILASVLALAQEAILKTFFLVRTYGFQTLWTAVPNVLLVFFTFAMVHLSPTILLRNPRVMMHLINGLFTEQTTQLLLCHVVGENYNLRDRWCLFPPVCLAVMMACVPILPESVDTLLLTYTFFIWVHLAFKVRVQLYEICDVLGIWCFDIVTPYPKRFGGVEDETAVGPTVPAVNGTGKKTN